MRTAPRIRGVGTAVPAFSYTQDEVLDLYRIEDERIRSVFRNSAIKRRYLTLPGTDPDGTNQVESQGELLAKHRKTGIDMGVRALQACLKDAELSLDAVQYLCCVSSTGFLTPGFSALLIRELGLWHGCGRIDIVGMGCNAGLNGLGAVASWARAHPGQVAVMVCIEACSAAYVMDGTMRTAVVNSLFGDGAAAVALVAEPEGPGRGPTILKFASCLIPDAIDAMRFDWDDEHGKLSFFLDRDIPYVVGANAEGIVGRLLDGTGLRRGDVRHWTIHSGGRKVVDSMMVNLGLSRHDVRHTAGVLEDFGNLSSGSFLFSYERLCDEGVVAEGDHGVFLTMGPGSTIEAALVRY
ncbi:3,5-dihydroxyphenylacetyl-CoA synthase DpgA [Amycolatopsis sp. cmx-11-12]|uniref:3,5-dihydroxyphenylacetyl-CoA synthase DpgA n=1 Tax=Amycolatopsis sp. cmx-11-12 TaxID=2785795 RepID=UPI003916F9F6